MVTSHITTKLTDTNLTQHHVGSDESNIGYSMITDPVTTVDIGLDTKWDYHFAEDGKTHSIASRCLMLN